MRCAGHGHHSQDHTPSDRRQWPLSMENLPSRVSGVPPAALAEPCRLGIRPAPGRRIRPMP
ncbi:MAG: hypothetical protein MZV64_09910 [Ignavibacteriales bacterium]|nr:hypothetical protein [Ignavibacteriales bacterium]